MDTKTGYETKSFWDQYREYVKESFPRHSSVVRALESLNGDCSRRLLDLGCGDCQEALQLMRPSDYFAVDSALEPKRQYVTCSGIKCDYRKFFHVIADQLPFPPDSFSSIFSSEVTGPVESNYNLYNRVFRTFPSIQYGIVSGFYYGRRRDQEKVSENGGIESFQSIIDLADINSPLFSETRILIPAPSKMFGNDVIEVWKLLRRK